MTLIAVLTAAGFLSCSFADASEISAAILEKMPAANAQAEYELDAKLVKAGPDAIKEICDLIVPPGTGDDTKARYVLRSLSSYTSRPDADAEQKMYASVLTEALAKAADNEVKFVFINQLKLVGGSEAVSALSGYLNNERLCEPAAMALLTIGTDAAEKAFLKALPKASQKNLPTIIHALGQMRSKSAIRAISKHASSKDATIKQVSLRALANIGDKSSEKILAKTLKTKNTYEQALAFSNYLLLAERLNEAGDTRRCVKICRKLIKGKYPAGQGNVPSAALSILTDAIGDKAIDYLLDAVDSDDQQFQAAALALAGKIKGPKATAKWTKKLKKVSSDRQIKIIDMLGRRGDKSALKTLREVLNKAGKPVKLESLKAIAKLDGPAAIADLMAALDNAEKDEIKTLKSILMQLPAEPLTAAAIKSLPKVPADSQIVLVEILAERHAAESVDMVFSLTASKDSSVNIAATKALGKLARSADLPRLIDLMLNAENSRQQSEASRVVVRLCLQNDDVQARAEPLLAAMKDASTDQKISIIKLLPAIGGSRAFEAVLAGTKSTDPKILDAAIRSLAKWKNVEALNALFEIANTTKETSYHVITLKCYIDIVAGSDIAEQYKVVRYERALATAKRTEEQKLTLSKLGLIRTNLALGVVGGFVDNSALSKEATLAAMKIIFGAGKDQPLKGNNVIPTLQKIVKSGPGPETMNKAKPYLDALLKEQAKLNNPPAGFVALFNGTDLTGWKGLLASPYDNPAKQEKLTAEQLKVEQAKADDLMRKHWKVADGVLYFDGSGHSLATAHKYGDFEMLVDWKLMTDNGDSGIYLRGSPQVQIWDPAHHKVGSGGLYNNKKNPSKPTVIADKPIGQWNTFRIKMVGEKVTVHLNGKLVVDNVTLENYWDRSKPIFPTEQIELQCHGDPICFRNIFIRRIPRPEEFISLFNGRDLAGWVGDTKGYIVKEGNIASKPGVGGDLFTEKEYSDFVLRFEFKLTDGANNGLGIRAPLGKNAAYHGMELQILENTAEKWANLKAYQYHGSIYGIFPAKRGYLKPVGQWNHEEVIAKGNKIKVILNGEIIVDADIAEATKDGTMDKQPHPGLFNKSGHIGFLGHGDVVEFRNIMIKEL